MKIQENINNCLHWYGKLVCLINSTSYFHVFQNENDIIKETNNQSSEDSQSNPPASGFHTEFFSKLFWPMKNLLKPDKFKCYVEMEDPKPPEIEQNPEVIIVLQINNY